VIPLPLGILASGLRLVAKILPVYHLARGMRAALGVIEEVPANLWRNWASEHLAFLPSSFSAAPLFPQGDKPAVFG